MPTLTSPTNTASAGANSALALAPDHVLCAQCQTPTVAVGQAQSLCFECWHQSELAAQDKALLTACAVRAGAKVTAQGRLVGKVTRRYVQRNMRVVCVVKWAGARKAEHWAASQLTVLED